MPIHHTAAITVSRFSLVYKIIAYILIVLILFTALAYATIFPATRAMFGELNELHLIRATGSYLMSLFRGAAQDPTDIVDQSGGSQQYNELMELYKQAGEIISDHTTAVTLGTILLAIWILLFSVALVMCTYPTSVGLYTFMSSNSEYGFCANFIANMRRSIAYAFASVCFTLVYMAVGVGIALGLGIWLSIWNNYIGLMVGYTVILLTIASNRALCGGWLPAMIVKHRPVKMAFADAVAMAKRTFVEMFGAYVVMTILFTILFFAIGLFTFGVGCLLVIALYIVFSQAYDMIMFMRDNGCRYYIDDQRVIDPNRHYKEALLEDPLEKGGKMYSSTDTFDVSENDGSASEGEEQK